MSYLSFAFNQHANLARSEFLGERKLLYRLFIPVTRVPRAATLTPQPVKIQPASSFLAIINESKILQIILSTILRKTLIFQTIAVAPPCHHHFKRLYRLRIVFSVELIPQTANQTPETVFALLAGHMVKKRGFGAILDYTGLHGCLFIAVTK
jgi:hypothetical protein